MKVTVTAVALRNRTLQFPSSMASSKLLVSLCIFHVLFATSLIQAAPANSKLFREYIGAEGKNIRFSDVPINPNVDFHFILSFAIDYTNTASPSPTNGDFSAFWDTDNLSPSQVSSIKANHPNVKVAMSLGGATVNDHTVFFSPSRSMSFSWAASNMDIPIGTLMCCSSPSLSVNVTEILQNQMQSHGELRNCSQLNLVANWPY